MLQNIIFIFFSESSNVMMHLMYKNLNVLLLKVRQISHIALKRDHEYVNTVQEGSEETHAKVRS